MARPHRPGGRVEPHPVVAHDQDQRRPVERDLDRHRRRPCVAERVAERLLGDAEDLALAIRVQPPVPGHPKRHIEPCARRSTSTWWPSAAASPSASSAGGRSPWIAVRSSASADRASVLTVSSACSAWAGSVRTAPAAVSATSARLNSVWFIA